MKKSNQLSKSAIIASVALASPMLASATTSVNPFTTNTLESGYQLNASLQVAEMKCGEGKCGSNMKSDKSAAEMKCGEGKCGSSMSSDKSASEGKCGEAKCGSNR